MSNEFKKGDYVDRKSGSYRFPGIVLSVYDNEGIEMCNVKLAGFRAVHIFNTSHLKKIDKAEYDWINTIIKELLVKEEDLLAKFITTEQKKGISKDLYEEHFIALDPRDKLSFCVNNNQAHKEDRGYVLYSLEQQGEPISIDTYFGMPREMAREFANKILEITK